ncbi:hypothetical protein [Actinomycetospora straminea]|uniref:Uncharacterized protein n=1 Tax=Actinomycetospora straminea TaxID=663607 RepID=A0ABP9EPG3_9PSEU|nr:hypothetical protein [Actinomycetospora straminea]MDD7935430.1 hypothetical protein [Actinomycetospora straminea]
MRGSGDTTLTVLAAGLSMLAFVGRRAGWWTALAWPVWLVGLVVGEVASRR